MWMKASHSRRHRRKHPVVGLAGGTSGRGAIASTRWPRSSRRSMPRTSSLSSMFASILRWGCGGGTERTIDDERVLVLLARRERRGREQNLARPRVEDGQVGPGLGRVLAPELVELGELLGLDGQAAALGPAPTCREPLVGARGIGERLRLAPRVVRRRAAAHAQERQRRARAHVPVALEDLLGRELVGQRGVVREAEDEADDRPAERETRRAMPENVADDAHDEEEGDARGQRQRARRSTRLASGNVAQTPGHRRAARGT